MVTRRHNGAEDIAVVGTAFYRLAADHPRAALRSRCAIAAPFAAAHRHDQFAAHGRRAG